MVRILAGLGVRDIAAFSLVSKDACAMARDDSLWRCIHLARWPEPKRRCGTASFRSMFATRHVAERYVVPEGGCVARDLSALHAFVCRVSGSRDPGFTRGVLWGLFFTRGAKLFDARSRASPWNRVMQIFGVFGQMCRARDYCGPEELFALMRSIVIDGNPRAGASHGNPRARSSFMAGFFPDLVALLDEAFGTLLALPRALPIDDEATRFAPSGCAELDGHEDAPEADRRAREKSFCAAVIEKIASDSFAPRLALAYSLATVIHRRRKCATTAMPSVDETIAAALRSIYGDDGERSSRLLVVIRKRISDAVVLHAKMRIEARPMCAIDPRPDIMPAHAIYSASDFASVACAWFDSMPLIVGPYSATLVDAVAAGRCSASVFAKAVMGAAQDLSTRNGFHCLRGLTDRFSARRDGESDEERASRVSAASEALVVHARMGTWNVDPHMAKALRSAKMVAACAWLCLRDARGLDVATESGIPITDDDDHRNDNLVAVADAMREVLESARPKWFSRVDGPSPYRPPRDHHLARQREGPKSRKLLVDLVRSLGERMLDRIAATLSRPCPFFTFSVLAPRPEDVRDILARAMSPEPPRRAVPSSSTLFIFLRSGRRARSSTAFPSPLGLVLEWIDDTFRRGEAPYCCAVATIVDDKLLGPRGTASSVASMWDRANCLRLVATVYGRFEGISGSANLAEGLRRVFPFTGDAEAYVRRVAMSVATGMMDSAAEAMRLPPAGFAEVYVDAMRRADLACDSHDKKQHLRCNRARLLSRVPYSAARARLASEWFEGERNASVSKLLRPLLAFCPKELAAMERRKRMDELMSRAQWMRGLIGTDDARFDRLCDSVQHVFEQG